MKYLVSWLKDYYKTSEDVSQIAEVLTALGSEVESISGATIDEKIVAVKIIKIEPHPNADRLQLATVFDGEKEVRLVCGAPNIEVGQIVPMARVGSRVLDFEIEEAEIRGVKSTGMLLSPRELGISKDHRGVCILDDSCVVGKSVREFLMGDVVLDLEITPNRGDLLSHFGLSRELSANKGEDLQKEEIVLEESEESAQDAISIDLKTKLCPLYLARVIKDVKVAPSPKWLCDRLEKLGAKPINNIVDVTNYVMLDLGHPLHAFDKNKLVASKIVIEQLQENCEVVTLDGVARALTDEMVVIGDGQKPVAIAGVMGLLNSQIDQDTVDIVLEAAVFDPKSIRKTRRLLGIQTEASYRFERGVDEGSVRYALDKAALMIAELSGAKILEGVVKAGEVKQRKKIKLESKKINALLGTKIDKSEMEKILTALGFEIAGDDVWVPLWRNDVSLWQDLSEEVGRFYSLEKIGENQIEVTSKSTSSDYFKKEKIKDALVEMGFDETINYTFLSQKEAQVAKLDVEGLVEVSNPIQEENRYLRNSLVAGLLKVIASNPIFDDIEIFEIGKIFDKQTERNSLAIACSGKSAQNLENVIKKLCQKLNIDQSAFESRDLSADELSAFKIKKPRVSVAQIDLDKYLPQIEFEDQSKLSKPINTSYRPISKYPPIKRDLAIIVAKEIENEQILEKIKESSEKAVLVELFDEFSAPSLGENVKSIAYHIYLEDESKTLSDQEAQEQMSKITSALAESFGAKLR